MYDICHPIYYNMSQLGCNDQVKLTTAFYVYVELCEVKRYWDVDYKYCETLQIFYLEARTSKNSTLETFIPWTAMNSITLDFIKDIMTALNKEILTFVFKEGDTTSVYYSICAGIQKPKSPEETKILKQKNEKKLKLEREIRRNTSNLYERALSMHSTENKSSRLSSSSKEEAEKEESDLNYFTAMDVSSSSQKTESSELANSSNSQDIDLKEDSYKKTESNESEKYSTNNFNIDSEQRSSKTSEMNESEKDSANNLNHR